MALQQTLPLFSPDVHIVSPRLAILVDDERLVAYSAADPIYSCALDDRDGMRLAAGMLSQMRLAPDTALAEALGVSREMVRRNRNLLVQGGVGAIHSDNRGPRTPYKLKKTARQRAQRCLDEGWSVNRTAREVGLTEGTLRYQIRQGRLRHPPKPKRGRPPKRPSFRRLRRCRVRVCCWRCPRSWTRVWSKSRRACSVPCATASSVCARYC